MWSAPFREVSVLCHATSGRFATLQASFATMKRRLWTVDVRAAIIKGDVDCLRKGVDVETDTEAKGLISRLSRIRRLGDYFLEWFLISPQVVARRASGLTL